MGGKDYYEKVQDAAMYVRRRITLNPKIGIVLGSGLGNIASLVKDLQVINYSEIPNFPTSSVEGHDGKLIVGSIGKKQVMVMQGRVHFYEGYSMKEVTFPVRVMKEIGIETLILTNAAGGINSKFKVGDVMLIEDHINLVGISGHNALRGWNDNSVGVRFPNMIDAYNPDLRRLIRKVAASEKIKLVHGVYAYVSGPNFETHAEVKFLKTIGADAVGMSTVPEVLIAKHSGMKVVGLSGISNILHGRVKQTSIEDINHASKVYSDKIESLLLGILKDI